MNVDVFALLEHGIVAITFAVLIVLGLRSTLRRRFGATHAYALWLLVPLTLCACLLPGWMPRAVLPVVVLNLAPVVASASHLVPLAKTVDYIPLIIGIWIAGGICFGAFQCWQQWRFVSGLGRLERVGVVYRAQSKHIGPALVGLLRPKIVVPFDFASRYSPVEQDLILAHECAHLQRGDLIANAFCALLQTVFWFHPLMYVGALCFRADQELACDASVMRSHRSMRKTYAETMLKTQTLDFALPAGCRWQSKQLLKERIMQLNRQSPSPAARQIGGAIVTAMICLIVCGAWAAQSSPTLPAADANTKPIYDVSMTVKLNGDARNIKIKAHDGEQFVIKQGEGDDQWEETVVLHANAGNAFMLETAIKHKNEMVGHPSLLLHEGQPATIAIGAEPTKYELVVDAHVATTDTDVKPTAKSGS
jgi:bla regulator protein BlaR1